MPDQRRPSPNPGEDVPISLANRFMMEDASIKDYAAVFYAGQLLCLYAAHRIRHRLSRLKCPEGADLDKVGMRIMEKMRDEAGQGGTLSHIASLVAGHVLPKLRQDGKVRNRQKDEARRLQSQEGTHTPYAYLNTQLGGGVKSGEILIYCGEDRAVDMALDQTYDMLQTTKVSCKRFVEFSPETGEDDKHLVGRIWWEHSCNSRNRAKSTFSPYAGMTAIVIDDMDYLVSSRGTRQERLDRTCKRILQAIPRRRQRVIMGLKSSHGEEMPLIRQDVIHTVGVALRKLNDVGPERLLVAGQLIEDENEADVSGSDDNDEGRLEELPGGAEAGESEGSSEDQGQGD